MPAAGASQSRTAEARKPQSEMREGETGRMPGETSFTDFATLVPPRQPNNWLIAPASFGSATPDELAPTVDASAEQVVDLWIRIIEEQPRARVLGVSEDGLQVEAEQASALFGFTDRISLRVLAAQGGGCTLVAYSRAETGYWDLGVNRSRLREWLAALQAQAASERR